MCKYIMFEGETTKAVLSVYFRSYRLTEREILFKGIKSYRMCEALHY